MSIFASTLPPDAFGWLASALTLLTFLCTDMRHLRYTALGANAAFIVYGASAQLWPVLALHLLLVPVNLWRLARHAPGGRPLETSPAARCSGARPPSKPPAWP